MNKPAVRPQDAAEVAPAGSRSSAAAGSLPAEVARIFAALDPARDPARLLAAGGSLAASSPIDGALLAALVPTGEAAAEAAIGSAADAFLVWRLVPAPRRGELVRLLGEELRRAKPELGRLVTIETGKILSEGLGEVQEMIDICDFAVGLSRQLYGLTLATERASHRMMETWHPLGICGVISAFNFPVAVWCWNAAIALVCGDPVVWKPSEKTSLCALAVDALMRRALARFDAGGEPAPAGLSAVLIGGRDLGERLVDDPRIALSRRPGRPRWAVRSVRGWRRVSRAHCSNWAATMPASSALRPISTSRCGRSRLRRWVPPASAARACAACSSPAPSTTNCCRG
jgi:aldehyde dehydrogenase (NAD+)